MFKITKVKAENFVLYEDLNVDFESFFSEPLIFVIGENRDSLGADSNGSGKSLFFDLITDLLFDRTVRGHSPDSLIGNFGKGYRTEICLANNEYFYRIIKYRKYKEIGDKVKFLKKKKGDRKYKDISGGKKAETYSIISSELGLNWLTFRNRNYYGQGDSGRFLMSSDFKKSEIISDILGLDIIKKSKAFAHKEFLKNKKEQELKEKVIEESERNYIDLKRLLSEEKARVEARKKKTIEAIKKEKKLLKKFKSQLKYAIEEAKGQAPLRKKIAGLKADIDCSGNVVSSHSKLQRYVSKLESSLASETSYIEGVVRKISQLKIEMCDLKNRVTTRCSKCGSKLTDKTAETLEKSLKDEMKIFSEKEEKSSQKISKTKSDLLEAKKRLKLLDSKMLAISSLIDKREKLLKKLRAKEKWESQKESIECRIETIESKIESFESAEFHNELMLDTERAVNDAEKKLRNLENELEFIINCKDKNSFSEFVFEKTMRTLFRDFLEELNFYSNQFLSELSDNGIEIRNYAKKKKNGIAEETKTVVTELGGEPRDFKTYSGGERGKIDLATQIAMFLSGDNSLPFLFLDEPFTGLDREGRERVVSLLKDIAMKDSYNIMVVTHDDIITGHGGIINIIRENNRSYIDNES